jgi:hypothetical protein
MIKSGHIEELSQAGFHYITAITKPQIETLLAGGVLQMALFDDSLCEVEQEGVRYVLRRNPVRAAEMAATRAGKQASVEVLIEQRNQYLAKHAKAKGAAAEKEVLAQITRLKAASWLRVESVGRSLRLVIDEAARTEAARLDGCASRRACRGGDDGELCAVAARHARGPGGSAARLVRLAVQCRVVFTRPGFCISCGASTVYAARPIL